MKLITLFLLIACLPAKQLHAGQKATIGETAWINVANIPFTYLARVDTGAQTTSIHAVNIRIINGSARPTENIGKTITFQTTNGEENLHLLSAQITRVSNIKSSQRVEQRYVIELPLSWNDVQKNVEVNLRDRSKMIYKLLIGRNFLSEDFLVDVDMEAGRSKQLHLEK